MYNKYLYIYTLFVFNKRCNGWTDRVQIFGGSSQEPKQGFWMVKDEKFCSEKMSPIFFFIVIHALSSGIKMLYKDSEMLILSLYRYCSY